jgi:hypothetical protein
MPSTVSAVLDFVLVSCFKAGSLNYTLEAPIITRSPITSKPAILKGFIHIMVFDAGKGFSIA